MDLKGSLSNFPLPDVIQFIGSARRTGLLAIMIGGNRASIYFEEGAIVHADYRDLAGQAVINRIFPMQEGNFQFFADALPAERTFTVDWMGAIMEAARVNDEAEGGGGGDLDGLDALEGGGGGAAAPKPPPRTAWDAARAKARMHEALRQAFGKKVAKLEAELDKCPDTKIGLLDFCTKAEKYIYVFLDSGKAKPLADGLRNIVEEPEG